MKIKGIFMTKKEIIIFIIFIVLCIVGLGIKRLNDIAFFNPVFHSSNQKMLIVKRENANNENQIEYYYIVFNKHNKCTAAFCEFINPPENMTFPKERKHGFINAKFVDNIVYAEVTLYRGRSYDEVLKAFEKDTIIKSW